jgi:hypothetical protein
VRKHDSRELVRVENEWLSAKDQWSLDRIIANDFVGIGVMGTLESKSDRIVRFHPGATPPAASERLEDVKVRFTDVFHFRDGRWVAVNAQEDFVILH